MDLKTQFATQLKQALTKTGVTQRELSERLGIGEGKVSRYANGKENPTLETVQKVFDALKIPVVLTINI